MSVSLPSIALFPGAPAGTPLAPGAEGLAAFGALPANSDVVPAFGSMLAAATAAPAAPAEALLTAAATPDGGGNPTMLATPAAMPVSTGPTAPTAMPVPFHWSPAEDLPAPTIPDFATNEEVAVDLGMNASADRSGLPSSNAEPTTTDASTQTAVGEPVALATADADVPPTISLRPPEAPTAFRPTTSDRTDLTGQEVPVTPARTPSRQRNLTVPIATRSTTGAAPTAAFFPSVASVTSGGRREIPTTKAGALATPTSQTNGWRNPVGPVVAAVPVAVATTASESTVSVIAIPDVVSPILPVTPAVVPSVPAAANVAPSQPAMPANATVAAAPTPAAVVAQPAGSAQPVLPGVETPALSREKPSIGHRSKMPVAVQPTTSAQPAVTAAAAPAAIRPAAVVVASLPPVVSDPVVPAAIIVASLPPMVTEAVAPVVVSIAPSQPASTDASMPIAAAVAPSQPAMPVAQPVVVVATAAVAPIPVAAQPVISRAEAPKFQIEMSGIESSADLPAGPKAPTLLTPATTPAAPIAAMVLPALPPMAAAESVVGVVAPAVVAPVADGNPIPAGQGMPPTPVALPVVMAEPVVQPAALPTLPATPSTEPAASTIFQPKIYEQQILAGQKEAMPSLAPSLSVPPELAQPAVPLAFAPETLSGNTCHPTSETSVPHGMGVLPRSEKGQSTSAAGSGIQDFPTPAIGTFTIPALSEPVIVVTNPAATVPALDATALPSTVGEKPVSQLPETTLSPISMPVVAVAAVAPDEIVPSNFAGPRSQPQLPATIVEAGFPWQQTPDVAPVEGPAIITGNREHLPSPRLGQDKSSLLQLNDLISSAATPAPLANLAMPAPVPVAPLPVFVAGAPAPAVPSMPVVASPGLTAATAGTLAPNVERPSVLSGQEVPVPTAALPVIDVSSSAPVTASAVPVAKSTAGLAPTSVVAPEISPAKADDTKPVAAQGSRPARKGKRHPAFQTPVAPAAAPALASILPTVVAVARTAVANSVIPATASLIVPVPSSAPVIPDPSAAIRPVVPPAALPADVIAGPTRDGVVPAPQLSSRATAIAGDDLASAPAVVLRPTPSVIAPEPGGEATGKTRASDDQDNGLAPISVSRQARATGISLATPMGVIGNPADLAPTTVIVPTGLPEISSPVSAPDESVGTGFPATASVAAFSSQFHAASGSPVTALPDDSRNVLPSAEEADPVAPGVDFSPKEAIRLRPTAEAMVASHMVATEGIVPAPLRFARVTVATKPVTLAENLATPISLNVAAPARVAGSPEAPMPAEATPAEPMPKFVPLAATPSEVSGANTAPASSGLGTDVKPESHPAFSPAAPTRDAATTPLPVSNSGEERSQPAGVATGADTSSAAEITAVGAAPEKFAVPVTMDDAALGGVSDAFAVKNTIDIVGQEEAKPTAHTGINAAKKPATMLSDQPQTSSAAPTSKSPAPAVDNAARVEVSTITAPKPETSRSEWVQPAGRTLAIVRDVAERMQNTANRVVEFEVNSQPGAQLSVRLEYRGGVVHTTFRTDSADLRDTLSREWQSAMPSVVTGERSVRLAEPTFTPASASRGESQSFDLGGQDPRQPQQDTPQSQGKAASGSEFAFARGTTARRPAAPAPAADTPAASALRPDTAQHLHAFA